MFPDLEFIKTCLNGLRNRIENLSKEIDKKVSDCIASPSTAEVGQAIVVTKVDKNGKPTEFGTGGSFGVETVYINAGISYNSTVYWANKDGSSSTEVPMTFAEAEELYEKWICGSVNILANTDNALHTGGGLTFVKVTTMMKEAADSSGSTYSIGFGIINSSGLTIARVLPS